MKQTGTSMLTILYDAATSSTPILTGVDNLTVTPDGDVGGGEDGTDFLGMSGITYEVMGPFFI